MVLFRLELSIKFLFQLPTEHAYGLAGHSRRPSPTDISNILK